MSDKFRPLDDVLVTTKIHRLNVNKIKDLEDVKRVLKFLNIEFELPDGCSRHGFEDVKDLFD
jgi:hypothetical protein